MNQSGLRIGFIGIGVLGKGLALAMASQHCSIDAVYSRTRASSQWLADRLSGCRVYHSAQELSDATDVVFITTPDSVIGEVAASVNWRPGQAVIHCSGSQPPQILANAAEQGALIGGFHPLQTFAGLTRPEEAVARLSGVTFAVAAEDWLADFLYKLAQDLGGRAVTISDSSRPLYHASAVLACGYLAALMQVAVDSWRAMGFTDQEALSALLPLAATTVENIGKHGVAASVTGPVVRGDTDTVKSHLEALSKSAPESLPVYTALTSASLLLATERGLDTAQLEQIRKLVDDCHWRYSACPE